MFVENEIKNKLMIFFNPIYLNVINESHLHHGGKGQESHFKIEIVSKKFENLKRLERHRIVQNTIANEIGQIKAFSIHPFTETEWLNRQKTFEKSPSCRGAND